jgi:RNA polymerase sigma-70 factor (ECF subfamily)
VANPAEEVEDFCRRIHPRLLGALSLYCGDIHVAEELAQEAIVRIWERWPKVSRAAAPEAYAHRMAFNLASSFFRRHAAEQRARGRIGTALAADEDRGMALDVRRAVRALPPRQRQAVVLRFYVDLPLLEVGGVMGCAEGTVKAHLYKATAALRRAGLGVEEAVEVE